MRPVVICPPDLFEHLLGSAAPRRAPIHDGSVAARGRARRGDRITRGPNGPAYRQALKIDADRWSSAHGRLNSRAS
jgi:hypothetical protein